MSEMIEKIAQAILDGPPIEDMMDAREAALNVLEAMREPSQGILDCRPPFMKVEDAKAMWQAMIETALQR